jgi:signal peptidase I
VLDNNNEVVDDDTHARKPWLAGVMSMFLPGLGQLYNGQPNRAIWFFIAFGLFALPVTVVIALALPGVLLVPCLLLASLATFAVWVYSIIDAVVLSRRHRTQFVLQRWQTNGLYALVLVIGAGVVLPSAITYVRDHLVQAFRVVGASMEPTILPGELFFVDKRYNCPECPGSVQRGDVAVFVYPNDRTRYYVKRVIGLPGDRIKNDGTGWSVNARPLASASGQESIDGRHWATSGNDSLPQPMTAVHDGHAYVLGDHRDASRDSRDFGMVPLVDIVGVARQVWFSRGDEGIRWQRLGVALNPSRS